MEERLDCQRDAMKWRRQTPEHSLGTLEARMGATAFPTKRRPRVSTETSLHVRVYDFKRVTRIAGYVAIGIPFGVVVDGVDTVLHVAAAWNGWLARHGWAIGAAALALAGSYQFSRLKHVCLDRCRSPMSFIMENWSSPDARRDSLRLGVRHGIFCVGCCWSLMVVMFVVGAGSIGWMLVVATVMAAVKNLAWRRMLARPLGAALLACAAAIVVAHAGWPAQ